MADSLQRHPQRVTAALAAVFLLGGGGAFAVANGSATDSNVKVREITHSVQTQGLAEQVKALEGYSFQLSRQDTSRQNDTADSLLSRLGVVDAEAAAFIRQNKSVREALLGTSGRTVSAQVDERQRLVSLTTRWIDGDEAVKFSRLVVERDDQGLLSRVESAPLTAATRVVSGQVDSKLFTAMDEARIPDSVTDQLTEIFSGLVDFHRSVRRGDRFTLVYEVMEADGEALRAGRVLSAEFINRGKRNQAMWFEQTPGNGGYYTPDGKSLKRSYTVAPLAFTRVSSNFGSRNHPIFGYVREHSGVDYAAPTGTPVRTVGDGQVTFAGVQSGYGNVVFVDHGQGQSTVYAHLSRIDVAQGQKITQGTTIGAVGSTGYATGPHLHFEFRINNEPHDPAVLADYARTQPIAPELRQVFKTASAYMSTQMAAAKQLQSGVMGE
ncbi:peptidase M23 [Comamonas serinivorans]|uniref:Peptidase M23 n=1 Tax=Comamonas serinivorans TaxID=1082851 RepID=A0A1Y0ERZ5_9BURK|nr:M23 family metallopeptidase [Comamonas serinivorans]ARU06346.1 peptidase M23 [Comamonas serinivorans]